MTERDLSKIKAAQRADLRARAQARADGRRRRRPWMDWWTDRLHRWARLLKEIGVLAGTAGALVTGAWRISKYIDGRRVSPADLPANGTPTTAMDLVPEPDAGTPERK